MTLSRRVFISHVQAVNLETFFATIRINGCAAATIWWDNSSSFYLTGFAWKKGPVLYIQIHRRIDWDHHRRHIEIWFWNKNPDELARQQKQQQHSQLILRSPPEQEHSPQVIIIMATIIIIKIICAFWMCIVVCLCSLCWNVN